jgi:methionyl-tRNA formyltransferase
VAEDEADGVRILFWGTPDFGLPALSALLGEGHEVIGVVTQPDRPAGRGRAVRSSAVKSFAEAENIPVLQPEQPSSPAFVQQMMELRPELNVVIAYGRILKRPVLDLPEAGSINVHASLLPQLRGAAPINWAIIRGHSESGVTVMRMVERMDAGPILFQTPEPILADERASDLWTRLSEIGAAALVEALALLEAGQLEEREQDESQVTFAPRIERKHTEIDWNADAITVDRLIRGLDETPGARTRLDGHELKLFRPRPAPDHKTDAKPGTVVDLHPNDPADGFLVACGRGAIWIREVQAPGKRRMTAAEWARGRTVRVGDQLQ